MGLYGLISAIRRHLVIVALVLCVAVGIAYSFKRAPLTYSEHAVIVLAPPGQELSPPYSNPYAPPFGTSLISTGELMEKWMDGEQGQQDLQRAGIEKSFGVALINFSNQEYPYYGVPDLAVSSVASTPSSAHSALLSGIRIFTQGLTQREMAAQVPPNDQIAVHVIGDGGPASHPGSSKRALAGLVIMTIIAMCMITSFVDRRRSLRQLSLSRLRARLAK